MKRLAWLAWHNLLPWRKQGDTSTPADLLGLGAEKTETKPVTKEEAQRELAKLAEEMGVR